jgi:hypothetical protein
MDYSQYFVVPKAAAANVAKLFEERRIIDDGKFLIVISDDHKAADKLDVVLDFHNDEWAAWGFLLLAKGKQVAQGIFGENAESGISLEDNCLEGDLDKAAALLGCNAKKLRTVLEGDEPDVEKFIKVVGFGRYSITPYELDRATRSEKQELFDPPKAKKPAAKKTVKKKTAKKKTKKPAAKKSKRR